MTKFNAEKYVGSYPVLTVSYGEVTKGAQISIFSVSQDVTIPAILVGETGRGRELGVLPVTKPPYILCPHQKEKASYGYHGIEGKWDGPAPQKKVCDTCGVEYMPWEKHGTGKKRIGRNYTTYHPEHGDILGQLTAAEIGVTRSGRPKLFAKEKVTATEYVALVLKTGIGNRGRNGHTSDRTGWYCRKTGCYIEGKGPTPDKCPKCGHRDDSSPCPVFGKFPGDTLARGQIAQGKAGYAGQGEQLVAMMPRDVVFRIFSSGTAANYLKWTGSKLLCATWEERQVSDAF